MKSNRIWIGRWITAVAALHTLFAIIVFGQIFLKLGQSGWFDSVGVDPMLNAAVWFMLFGAPLALLGITVHAMEKTGKIFAAQSLGWGLFLLGVVGVTLMPASGFWLIFPPALVLCNFSLHTA